MQIIEKATQAFDVQASPLVLISIFAISIFARWIINILAHHIPDKMIYEWKKEIAQERNETFIEATPCLKKSAQETPFLPKWTSKPDLVQMASDIFALLSPVAITMATHHLSYQNAAFSLLIWICCLAMLIDKQYMLLPDVVTQPALWLGLLSSLLGITITPESAIAGAAVGYIAIFIFATGFKAITKADGIGMGDAKWLAVTGAWFGFEISVHILIIATALGVLHSLISKEKEFALGPMLCTATVIACFRQLVF